MAEIRRFPALRHLRSETTEHILRYQRGRLRKSGTGVTFWFTPMSAAIANVPVDARELPFLIMGKTNDFQEVTIQGEINYRVADPEKLSTLIDFSIDLLTGHYVKQPLDQVANLLVGNVQQIAVSYLADRAIRDALSAGPGAVREQLDEELIGNTAITEMGIDVIGVQVKDVSPTPELEKALQTPTREKLQQQADEAAFERRAMAVENERAIAENELNNQIELAKQETALIERNGANAQQQAAEEAAANAIQVEAEAKSTRTAAEARADQIRMVEGARVTTERERLDIYRDMTPALVLGLAAQELAGKLRTIEHLNVTPDLLATGLNNLLNLKVEKA
jgi:regulator of protease activity HflC (stomatin/prohibitin superfamily)